MNSVPFDLKYVICFLIKDNHVLMIQRIKHPWKSRWNGAGGHIEKNEMPKDAVYRAIYEETQIDLKNAKSVKFAGIVTWDVEVEKEDVENGIIPGMYVYIAELSDTQKIWHDERVTPEGIIAWKTLEWVCDKHNQEVAGNIPYFLPSMLTLTTTMRYHCVFRKGKLVEVKQLDLPEDIIL